MAKVAAGGSSDVVEAPTTNERIAELVELVEWAAWELKGKALATDGKVGNRHNRNANLLYDFAKELPALASALSSSRQRIEAATRERDEAEKSCVVLRQGLDAAKQLAAEASERAVAYSSRLTFLSQEVEQLPHSGLCATLGGRSCDCWKSRVLSLLHQQTTLAKEKRNV